MAMKARAVFFANVVNGADIGVIQRGDDPGSRALLKSKFTIFTKFTP